MPTGNNHQRHNEFARNANKRAREALNKVAADNGFDTWADLQRAIRKDGATVLQNAQYVTAHNGLGSYTFVMSARDAESFSLFCEQQGLMVHFESVKDSVRPDVAEV